jgi:hypothetical protein
MTSPTRSFTNVEDIRIRPFAEVADSRYGGYPPFIGLCRDICTVFLTIPAGHPHPRPPGMGKADRLGQRVPLPPPRFAPAQKPFRHRNAPNVPLFPPHFTPTEKPLRASNVA